MGTIQHQHQGGKGSFYYEADGKKLAEMVYTMEGEHKMVIEHTEVDDSLRGQGIGKKLQEALVQYLRAHHIKVLPLCPFAKATFDKMQDWQDVLV